MTVAELIEDVLRRIQSTDWYHGRIREFARDRRALTKAIARYGYACAERGWHFQPEVILKDLLSVLRDIVEKRAAVDYFPIYLEGAIDKHIRQRAEELSELAKQSKSVEANARRIMAGQNMVQMVQPTSVEVLDKLYRDLKRRKVKRQPPVAAKQKEFGL